MTTGGPREDTRRAGGARSLPRAGGGAGAGDASVPASQRGGGPGADFQKAREPGGITVPFVRCGSRSSGLWGSHTTTDPPSGASRSGRAGGLPVAPRRCPGLGGPLCTGDAGPTVLQRKGARPVTEQHRPPMPAVLPGGRWSSATEETTGCLGSTPGAPTRWRGVGLGS